MKTHSQAGRRRISFQVDPDLPDALLNPALIKSKLRLNRSALLNALLRAQIVNDKETLAELSAQLHSIANLDKKMDKKKIVNNKDAGRGSAVALHRQSGQEEA